LKIELNFKRLLLGTRIQLRACAVPVLGVHSFSSEKERTKKADLRAWSP
jgi:hypothetical protein